MLKFLHFQKIHVSPKSDIYLPNSIANEDECFCVCIRKSKTKNDNMNTCKNHEFITLYSRVTALVLKSLFFSFPKKKRQRRHNCA